MQEKGINPNLLGVPTANSFTSPASAAFSARSFRMPLMPNLPLPVPVRDPKNCSADPTGFGAAFGASANGLVIRLTAYKIQV